MLTQTNEQITKLIEEARASAARVKDEETQKAIASAEQILAKAREAAQQDYSRMLADLKRELGRLVVQATTKVTGKILTPEDHTAAGRRDRRANCSLAKADSDHEHDHETGDARSPATFPPVLRERKVG